MTSRPEANAYEPESATVTVSAFGHHFVDYPTGLAEDLITLEREGAIYAHFADEDSIQPDRSATFRYYRIRLLPTEIFQYVEACVAFQEFNETIVAAVDEGQNVETHWLSIGLGGVTNPEIAARVRRYGDQGNSMMRDGEVVDLRGCHASFYPDGLEALICGARLDRAEELPEINRADKLGLVMQILNNLGVAARVLGDRQRKRPAFVVETEYDIQDLLFTVLRAVFPDAKREEGTPKHAGSAKRIDIVLPSVGALIETKFVRDRSHAGRIADELKIDIESYYVYERCVHVIALVWDPGRHLADPNQFETDLSGHRQKGSASFDVTVVVR